MWSCIKCGTTRDFLLYDKTPYDLCPACRTKLGIKKEEEFKEYIEKMEAQNDGNGF